MHNLDPHSLRPEDLERMVSESERSARRLNEVAEEITSIEGAGRSWDGLVTAKVDSGGGLLRTTVERRAMRLSGEELAERITEAVRDAQTHAQEQAERLLSEALGHDVVGDPVTAEELERHLREIQDSFSRSVGDGMSRIDGLRRRSAE